MRIALFELGSGPEPPLPGGSHISPWSAVGGVRRNRLTLTVGANIVRANFRFLARILTLNSWPGSSQVNMPYFEVSNETPESVPDYPSDLLRMVSRRSGENSKLGKTGSSSLSCLLRACSSATI